MDEIERNKDIIFLTKHLNKTFENDFNNLLNKFGVTGQQARIILFINRKTNLCHEIVNQKMIEESFVLSKSTVSGLITRLEKKDFIKREQNQNSVSITLADKGLEMIDILSEARKKIRAKAFKDIDEKDQEAIINLLKKILNNVEEGNCVCGKKLN